MEKRKKQIRTGLLIETLGLGLLVLIYPAQENLTGIGWLRGQFLIMLGALWIPLAGIYLLSQPFFDFEKPPVLLILSVLLMAVSVLFPYTDNLQRQWINDFHIWSAVLGCLLYWICWYRRALLFNDFKSLVYISAAYAAGLAAAACSGQITLLSEAVFLLGLSWILFFLHKKAEDQPTQ